MPDYTQELNLFIKKNSAEISSNRVIYYKTTKGQDFENNLIDILYHIINHASYHRGKYPFTCEKKEITLQIQTI